MGKICAFFGHREIPENLEPRLRCTIRRAIEEYGVTEFWNGGFGEFDRLAEKVVYSMKSEYPQIVSKVVFAYPPQYSHRPTFDGAIYPEQLDELPEKWHIPRRNLWMAEKCDVLIAYVEHGGSKICQPLDAMTGKKPILNLGQYQPKAPEKGA